MLKVLVHEISYNPVLEYYNSHKDAAEEPLEKLDRFEGGFKIAITERKNVSYMDPNEKIRQVRWSRGYLKTPIGLYGFTEKQTQLLYESLVHTLGETNVLYN